MAVNDPHEPLPVVDAADRLVTVAPRSTVHRQGLLHRAVHVIVFDAAGRIYLQKRSDRKDTHPGKWTTSASGHVDPGETYDQAARRELREELGLDLPLNFLAKLPAGEASGREFSAVYRADARGSPVPDPDEIAELAVFTPAEARALASDPARAVPVLASVLECLPQGV